MPQLPERPNLDQLRRQARQLQRSAAAGDTEAVDRISRVGSGVSLVSAQLALAREYGFPSWARLKTEVEQQRAAQPAPSLPPAAAPVVDVRGWQGMREWSAQLVERSGVSVEVWKQRVDARGPADETALRAWLTAQGVSGYAQQLLVWERFGYPAFITAGVDQLIDGQYADRPHLRPIMDAVLAALPRLGAVTIQARKTYVSLVSPRRTFAVVQATTRRRVDLGLRLDATPAGGRLLPARGVGNDAITLRLALTTVEDVDDEALELLERSYRDNA